MQGPFDVVSCLFRWSLLVDFLLHSTSDYCKMGGIRNYIQLVWPRRDFYIAVILHAVLEDGESECYTNKEHL